MDRGKPPGDAAGEGPLDASVDALFRAAAASSPSPADGGAVGWDERADAVLARALAAPRAAEHDLDTLLGAPALAPEPGEAGPGDRDGSTPSGDNHRAPPVSARDVNDRNGRTMSDENPKPPSSRRPSLKELAESVKNRPSSPGGPSSQRPPPSLKDTLVALEGKTPPPPAPPSSVRPAFGSSSSLAGPPSARDAGPISAPPTSTPVPSGPGGNGPTSTPVPSSVVPVAVASAAPGSAAPTSAPSTKPSAVGAAAAKSAPAKSNVGVGVGIAALGLAAAAAFAFWTQTKTPDAPTAPTVAAVETAAPAAEASDEPAKEAPKEPASETPEGVIDISQLADANAAASAAPVVGGPLPSAPAAPSASAVAAKADPAKPAGPGEELDEAIRNRAGGGSDAPVDAEPAAGEPSKKNRPDVPPTGAVTSAINAVKGNAKGCVAGADEPSSATITFSSSGAVQGVSVGGWAQGKSAAACIKSAMSGARVPPFARPTYSTSVTIRP